MVTGRSCIRSLYILVSFFWKKKKEKERGAVKGEKINEKWLDFFSVTSRAHHRRKEKENKENK